MYSVGRGGGTGGGGCNGVTTAIFVAVSAVTVVTRVAVECRPDPHLLLTALKLVSAQLHKFGFGLFSATITAMPFEIDPAGRVAPP